MGFFGEVFALARPVPGMWWVVVVLLVVSVQAAMLQFAAHVDVSGAAVVRGVAYLVDNISAMVLVLWVWDKAAPFALQEGAWRWLCAFLCVFKGILRFLAVSLGPDSVKAAENARVMREDTDYAVFRSLYFVLSFAAQYLLPWLLLAPHWERLWLLHYPLYRGLRGGAVLNRNRARTDSELLQAALDGDSDEFPSRRVVRHVRGQAWWCCGSIGWTGGVGERKNASWPPGFGGWLAVTTILMGLSSQLLKPTGFNGVAALMPLAAVYGGALLFYDSFARPLAMRRLDPGQALLFTFLIEAIPVGLGNLLLTALQGVRGSQVGQLVVVACYRVMVMLAKFGWAKLSSGAAFPAFSAQEAFLSDFQFLLVDEVLFELVFLEVQPFTPAFFVVVAAGAIRTICLRGGLVSDATAFLRQLSNQPQLPKGHKWEQLDKALKAHEKQVGVVEGKGGEGGAGEGGGGVGGVAGGGDVGGGKLKRGSGVGVGIGLGVGGVVSAFATSFRSSASTVALGVGAGTAMVARRLSTVPSHRKSSAISPHLSKHDLQDLHALALMAEKEQESEEEEDEGDEEVAVWEEKDAGVGSVGSVGIVRGDTVATTGPILVEDRGKEGGEDGGEEVGREKEVGGRGEEGEKGVECGWLEEYWCLQQRESLSESKKALGESQRDLLLELMGVVVVAIAVLVEAAMVDFGWYSQRLVTSTFVMPGGVGVGGALAGYATIFAVQCVGVTVAWMLQVARIPSEHRTQLLASLTKVWSKPHACCGPCLRLWGHEAHVENGTLTRRMSSAPIAATNPLAPSSPVLAVHLQTAPNAQEEDIWTTAFPRLATVCIFAVTVSVSMAFWLRAQA